MEVLRRLPRAVSEPPVSSQPQAPLSVPVSLNDACPLGSHPCSRQKKQPSDLVFLFRKDILSKQICAYISLVRNAVTQLVLGAKCAGVAGT